MCLQIDVSDNSINRAGSLKFIAAMKGKSMVSIGMGRCKLGVKGAEAMAKLISVTPSLTRLNVRFNSLGDDGEAALRKAIEGRSGFELLL